MFMLIYLHIQGGVTPLMCASCMGSAELVSLLLQHGADPCAVTTDYYVRLFYKCEAIYAFNAWIIVNDSIGCWVPKRKTPIPPRPDHTHTPQRYFGQA